jgi:beta-phosphoglucomutase-like phosphatase (HAD superfamily)
MLSALIFDLDGTLVDSNLLHTEAWVRGFARLGYRIDADRVRPEMGKGGDNLVPSVLGPTAEERDGEALRAAVKEEYGKVTAERGVHVFDGAVELLKAVRERGLKTVLATSSSEDDLGHTFEAAGGAAARPTRRRCSPPARGACTPTRPTSWPASTRPCWRRARRACASPPTCSSA